jgi:peroxiredoxin
MPCVSQLGELQKNIKSLQELDTSVVAFSSRGKKDTESIRDQLGISFPLIDGPSFKVFKDFGVLNSKNNLAVPSTFLIDKSGVVRWRWIARDAEEKRPEVKTVLKEIRKLSK